MRRRWRLTYVAFSGIALRRAKEMYELSVLKMAQPSGKGGVTYAELRSSLRTGAVSTR